jgi:hypothetical protein
LGTTDSRLVTAILLAAFSTTMSCTKEFVTGALVAAREGTPSAATVGNAKPSGALGALVTSGVFAHTIPAMPSTIGPTRYSGFFASLDSTWLTKAREDDHRER